MPELVSVRKRENKLNTDKKVLQLKSTAEPIHQRAIGEDRFLDLNAGNRQSPYLREGRNIQHEVLTCGKGDGVEVESLDVPRASPHAGEGEETKGYPEGLLIFLSLGRLDDPLSEIGKSGEK